MPPPIGFPTPEQLLAEADATVRLARYLSIQRDKAALIEHAERLRERAHRLKIDSDRRRLQ